LNEPRTPEEEFEKLRQRFGQRLRREQARLAELTEDLGRTNCDSISIFEDIRAFAHRLRGAALVFGFKRIGNGAKAVELAVTAASLDLGGQRFDLSVASTMEALASSFVDEIGAGPPGAPPTDPSTRPSSRSFSW
jgi:Hpt domain